eukprot:5686700-Pyramimonas_sp.AAC.1
MFWLRRQPPRRRRQVPPRARRRRGCDRSPLLVSKSSRRTPAEAPGLPGSFHCSRGLAGLCCASAARAKKLRWARFNHERR